MAKYDKGPTGKMKNQNILHHNLPHVTLLLRISTPIGNVVQLKYSIHPAEDRKSQQPEKIKEETLQGSSCATTSIMNSIHCPGNNVMILLNGASTIIMVIRSRNMTKETQKTKERTIIRHQRKLLVRRWLDLYPSQLEITKRI